MRKHYFLPIALFSKLPHTAGMRKPFILFVALFLSLPALALEGKVVGITDGDTITVLEGKTQHKVRLHGIDAPEKKQAYGLAARFALSQLVFGKEVTVDVTGKDRYGRVIGKVKQGELDINRELLRNGSAWHYLQYDKSKDYAEAQAEAKSAGRGLWGGLNPIPPWEFRKKR